MIGYTYTITNRAGDFFKINDHVTDPENFIALQQYPDMDIDVKNNELDLDGQHGIWDFYSYFGKRNMAFSGVIIGEDEAAVETMRNLIVSVLALPMQPSDDEDGYVTISWEDATGEEWSIEAKINRSPRFGRELRQHYKLDFMLSFKAADAFILGLEEDESGERGYLNYGLVIPTILPAAMQTVVTNGINVENDGTVYAHTVIRLYGEASGAITDPEITNTTTGKSFTVNTTLANETKWIEIDSKEGTVVDQDGNDLSADIDPESQFILLKPGTNVLMYSSPTAVQSPAGVVTVTFKSTKI